MGRWCAFHSAPSGVAMAKCAKVTIPSLVCCFLDNLQQNSSTSASCLAISRSFLLDLPNVPDNITG
eukprot:jgi/Botrbrau1/23668/Bobra.55_2s0049.1